MSDRAEQIKAAFRGLNRSFQIGCAVLFACMGGLLLATLILQAPDLLKSLLYGEKSAVRTIIGSIAGVGLCWLQWRYRHVVYPQLRREVRQKAI